MADAAGSDPGREPHGRRRLRPVDLRVPRRRHPQHLRVRARLHGRQGRAARAELPVDAEHPLGRQRRHLEQLRPQRQEAVDGRRRRRQHHRLHRLHRARRGAVRGRRDRVAAPRRRRLSRHRRVLPHQRADARARRDLRALGAALPGGRRHEVLRARRDQGRDGLPHRRREPARRARAASHPEHAQARHRPGDRDGARELRRAERAVVPRGDACGRRARPRAEGHRRHHYARRGARRSGGDARPVGRGHGGGHEPGRVQGLRRARVPRRALGAARDAAQQPRPARRDPRRERRRARRPDPRLRPREPRRRPSSTSSPRCRSSPPPTRSTTRRAPSR